ncbi:MAG: thioesterase family protein [Nitriliruptoraceae bacterium]
METRFARDSAVIGAGDGRYDASLDDGWMREPGRLANGGYLLAVAARAMAAAADDRDPVSVTMHFLAPAEPGPARIDTEVLRHGRRHSTVAARFQQGGREIARVLGAFGALSHNPPVQFRDRTPPDWPNPDACVTWRGAFDDAGVTPPPIADRYDMRVPPGIGMWPLPAEGPDWSSGGYFRWADGDPADIFDVLAAADRIPSSVFNVPDIGAVWAPTIELTVEIFARPVAGHLVVRCSPRTVTDRYFEEDGELWDSAGALVAVSRQIALLGTKS